MKKAVVIGSPGSGKSFFSGKLSEVTGLPLYHLDMIYHRPDRTHLSREEFDGRLNEILQSEDWIIDGNYNRTIEMRLKACDTVFLFDLPTDICLEGARERIGKPRADLPWSETELDPEFEQFINEFPEKHLPMICSLLEKYADREIIVFKTREQAEEYLQNYIKE